MDSSPVVADARRLHNQLWGLPSWARHCPAPTPVSLGREDLPTVLSGCYAVTAKTDGERCSLVVGALALDPDHTYAVRFDRSGVGTELRLREAAPVDLPEDPRADPCEGTLLDCEWMADRRELVILDAVAVCGYGLRPVDDLYRRLRLGKRVARTLLLEDAEGRTVVVRPKPFLPLRDMGSIDAGTRADGLVFMPTRAPVQTGRAGTMFKWKPVHTVDAVFRDGRLWFGLDDGLVPIGDAQVRVDDTSSCREGVVYELGPTGAPAGTAEEGEVPESPFRVLHERSDKGGVPNQMDTVAASLRHMAEGIDLAELRTLIRAG